MSYFPPPGRIVGLAPISVAVTIGSISSLASAAYSAPSTLVDNTVGGVNTISYTRGVLRLAFGTALTAGSGAPSLTLFAIPALDGTNLSNPPGASATAPSPNAAQVIAQLVPSASFSVVDFPPLDLDPFKFGLQIYNGSGVAFSGTVTPTLYLFGQQLA